VECYCLSDKLSNQYLTDEDRLLLRKLGYSHGGPRTLNGFIRSFLRKNRLKLVSMSKPVLVSDNKLIVNLRVKPAISDETKRFRTTTRDPRKHPRRVDSFHPRSTMQTLSINSVLPHEKKRPDCHEVNYVRQSGVRILRCRTCDSFCIVCARKNQCCLTSNHSLEDGRLYA